MSVKQLVKGDKFSGTVTHVLPTVAIIEDEHKRRGMLTKMMRRKDALPLKKGDRVDNLRVLKAEGDDCNLAENEVYEEMFGKSP